MLARMKSLPTRILQGPPALPALPARRRAPTDRSVSDASRLASLSLSYVSAFVAPRQPGASTAIIDRLSRCWLLGGEGYFVCTVSFQSRERTPVTADRVRQR